MTTRHLSGRDEFIDLVLADDEFVRAEFEAIVAGFDDPPPAQPARPGPPSRGAARPAPAALGPRSHRPLLPERARQRSPPSPGDPPRPLPGRSRTPHDAAEHEPHARTALTRAARQSPDEVVPAPRRGRLVVFPRSTPGADMTDPRHVLGVAEDATQEEITAAYHRLVRRYHPDTADEAREAEPDRFREVVAAYAALRAERPRPTTPRGTGTALRAGPVRYHGPPRR